SQSQLRLVPYADFQEGGGFVDPTFRRAAGQHVGHGLPGDGDAVVEVAVEEQRLPAHGEDPAHGADLPHGLAPGGDPASAVKRIDEGHEALPRLDRRRRVPRDDPGPAELVEELVEPLAAGKIDVHAPPALGDLDAEDGLALTAELGRVVLELGD